MYEICRNLETRRRLRFPAGEIFSPQGTEDCIVLPPVRCGSVVRCAQRWLFAGVRAWQASACGIAPRKERMKWRHLRGIGTTC